MAAARVPSPSSLRAHALDAIATCADAFLDPPIANLGGRGIRTAAARLPGLLERVHDPERDLPAIATMMERAGTGGALFRNLYRDFLAEVQADATEPAAGAIARAHDAFSASALLWTEVADLIAEAGRTASQRPLDVAARRLHRIHDLETEAMRSLRDGIR